LKGDIYCLTLEVVRFVWDGRKAAANLKKHRVSFEEASATKHEKTRYESD
jgi:uncharacterized DUF497 family protein